MLIFRTFVLLGPLAGLAGCSTADKKPAEEAARPAVSAPVVVAAPPVPVPLMASVLPATKLKKALDATGHVALYLNFDTDQATLKPDAQASVAQAIALLSQNPGLRLGVEGHTDNAGTPAHNQQLSEARARTVVATLTAQGIAPARLQAAGFGQSKPLADNASEAGKAKNRHVELVKL